MKHLAKNKPKHMIHVNGKPFLWYLLENLRAAGLQKFFIVAGYQAEFIEEFARTYSCPIRVINQFAVLGEGVYGTALPVKLMRDIIGAEQFLSVAGDNFYATDDIKQFMRDDQYSYVGATKTDHPERMGVLVTDSAGHLERIVEKPQTFVSDLANVSIYKFTPDIFPAIDRITLSPRGEYEITDAITLLAAERKMKVIELSNYWMDFGNPSDIARLSKFLKKT